MDKPLANTHDVKTLRRPLAGTLFPGCLQPHIQVLYSKHTPQHAGTRLPGTEEQRGALPRELAAASVLACCRGARHRTLLDKTRGSSAVPTQSHTQTLPSIVPFFRGGKGSLGAQTSDKFTQRFAPRTPISRSAELVLRSKEHNTVLAPIATLSHPRCASTHLRSTLS